MQAFIHQTSIQVWVGFPGIYTENVNQLISFTSSESQLTIRRVLVGAFRLTLFVVLRNYGGSLGGIQLLGEICKTNERKPDDLG